jgi:hypothetical protein
MIDLLLRTYSTRTRVGLQNIVPRSALVARGLELLRSRAHRLDPKAWGLPQRGVPLPGSQLPRLRANQYGTTSCCLKVAQHRTLAPRLRS